MKRLLIMLTLFINIFGVTAFATNKYVNLTLNYDWADHNYIAEEVFLNVNGQKLTGLPMPPIILNGYTLVPAREVFEKIGATVSWNKDREEVYVAKGANLLILKINSTDAHYNNKAVKMEIPAKLINSKTMIPVRFVSETFGYNVGWDKPTRTVLISEGEIAAATEATTAAAAQMPAQVEQTTVPTTQAPAPQTPTTQASAVQTQSTQTTTEDYKVITLSKDSSSLPTDLAALSSASYAQCKITDMLVSSDNTFLRIKTNSPISRVEKGSVGSDRVYYDIYNASSSIGRVKTSNPLPQFGEVRVGERSENGQSITRIAIDIKDSSFTCKLSADRCSLYIYFPTALINNYNLTSDAASDTFTVSGEALTAPVVQNNGTTLKVTFANTRLSAPEQTLRRNGYLVNTADISYFGKDTVITFALKGEAQYRTSVYSNSAGITIYDKNSLSISADSKNDTITIKKNGTKVNVNSILTDDNFENRKYTISIPGNYTASLGTGNIPYDGSERISSIDVSYSDGNTILTFNEKKLCNFQITEDGSNIYIKCVDIHAIYDKILVIDAGHGGSDPGASGNGLVEKDLTLDIVLKLKALFDKDTKYKVYYTRTTDTYPTLNDRSNFGNFVDCPFISVHINAVAGNTSANGIEVYWQYENTDENGLSSSVLANAVYNKLIEYTGAYGRGVHTKDLHVLRENNNPATLIEVGFISNPTEAANMGSDSYQQLVAKAIYDAVREVI